MTSSTQPAPSRQDQGRGSLRTGLRSARQKSSASTAYSVRCAPLRTTVTMVDTVSSERCGKKKRTRGPMMREERLKEWESPDAEKISTIQTTTGSQYLKNER